MQNYQKLNEWTVPNRYPLPLIIDLIHDLTDKELFTKFDVHWGYNNVHIKKGDEWKAAFKTSEGLFEPTVMFFGLHNSPATFQMMMDNIFQPEIMEG
jgi:Reverse transcriptase (RNA-dependent DNA polymerase)